jgi:hypothetical protein
MRLPPDQLIERVLDPLQQKPPKGVIVAAKLVLKGRGEPAAAQHEILRQFLQAAESARWL